MTTTSSWRLPLRPKPVTSGNTLTSNQIRVCPECAGPVVHISGCIAFRQCGWARCS
ncbi:MAG: hypothetical protein IPK12_23930 [Gemmatimonadetes bacterium]|nr:hypothetical protein [Gemmatimonadota bacterium]